VLVANQDGRADHLLHQGYTLLQDYAAKIADTRLGHSFLTSITVNREVHTIF
jgi:hypothetical protein